jgi:di/tricarboxylate transporter
MDIPDGLKGFSNKGLLTVACLFVVAAGISNTGALDYYMSKLLGTPKTVASAQVRLMVPVAFVSAFLNNTPVVAIMIPILQKWSKKCGIAPSQLFIPLSFASILGGTCTLIGTSTNLVVEGMMRERYPDAKPIGMFDLSMYGVPVALSGFAYILIFSPFLLPGGKKTAADGGGSGVEDSLAVGAVVAPGSAVINQPVATLARAQRPLPGIRATRRHAPARGDTRVPTRRGRRASLHRSHRVHRRGVRHARVTAPDARGGGAHRRR